MYDMDNRAERWGRSQASFAASGSGMDLSQGCMAFLVKWFLIIAACFALGAVITIGQGVLDFLGGLL